MPSTTVGNSVSFYFTDSGPPSDFTPAYMTIFLIHGHTFHSGAFQRLANIAPTQHIRTIALNRRCYPGSSSYTEEEKHVLSNGSIEERADLIEYQGILLALAIDSIIQELSLPTNVAVAGWSLGTSFLVSIFAAVNAIPETIRQRLTTYIQNFILLDPCCYPLGIPTSPNPGYVPLFDDALFETERHTAFAKWCTSYFDHPYLSLRDVELLKMREQESSRTPSIAPEDLDSVVTPTAAKYDTLILAKDLCPVLGLGADALFSQQTREEWGNPNISCIYGDSSPWNCIYAGWYLENRAERSNEINSMLLDDANHFFMWDYPERTLAAMKECCKS